MVQVRKRFTMSLQRAAACCRPVDGLLDPALFRALGDPTRVRMLACLIKCGRACAVGEVAECCSVDLSVVSRHLQALARAGILDAHKAGRTMSYSVRYEHLCRTLRGLADSIEQCAPARARAPRSGGRCGRC
jgi:ArsR family transcriptional regulator